MTINEMLGQSGVLALMGMGTVFVFLILIVLCVNVMGKIVQAFGGGKDTQIKPAAVSANAQASVSKTISGRTAPDTVAAITAAVTQFRRGGE
jgi:oxaloacetate decarboxylase gamma subunit